MTDPTHGAVENEARAIVETHGSSVSSEKADHLNAILQLVERAIRLERDRCVEICRDRAALWARTAGADESAPMPARDEARFRQNEARYLADAIETSLTTIQQFDA